MEGNRAQAIAEYRRTRSAELAEADRKSIGLRDDLIKAEQRSRQQTLLALVPVNSQLEIEARISNRDIGFVSAGAPARIKIDTFNFTRYGPRHGNLLGVSTDAIVQDKQGDRAQPANASDSSSQALVYSARVSLDQIRMQVDENIVDLTPGMAVTVEISIGSRAVMSYLLSPLLKYAHDSLREK